MLCRTRTAPHPLRAVLALALAGGTALATLTTVAAPPAQARDSQGDVEMITANIRSALSVPRFQADVSRVMAHKPDFVAYNEVPEREDSVLAPPGYAIYRGNVNRYTRATPVVWRTDKWSLVAAGTHRISNYRKRPAGKRVKLGLRYANWVTLRSAEGRQVSVVSMHVAPVFRDNGKVYDLVRPSLRRLGGLVSTLPDGPVLVGGDFNVHYRSGRYPKDLVQAAGLAPTYETLGTSFPTGDHGNGATIDYVFARGAGQLTATEHHPEELNSDHDAVVSGLMWQVDPAVETRRTVSDPGGSSQQKHLAVAEVARAMSVATAGERATVVTAGLGVRRVFRSLRRAVLRGVALRYITRSQDLTGQERRLRRVIAQARRTGSRFVRCRGGCRDSWASSGMSPTLALTPGARVDLSRRLSRTSVARRTQAVVHQGELALREADAQLAQLR